MGHDSDKAMRSNIDKHFRELMTPRIEKLSAFARLDLYYGPINGCDRCGADTNPECECEHKYVGFESALDEIKAWVEENLQEVWYDMDCDYVALSEPPESEKCYDCDGLREDCDVCNGNGWVECYRDNIYHFDRKEVCAIVLGKELPGYL